MLVNYKKINITNITGLTHLLYYKIVGWLQVNPKWGLIVLNVTMF